MARLIAICVQEYFWSSFKKSFEKWFQKSNTLNYGHVKFGKTPQCRKKYRKCELTGFTRVMS